MHTHNPIHGCNVRKSTLQEDLIQKKIKNKWRIADSFQQTRTTIIIQGYTFSLKNNYIKNV